MKRKKNDKESVAGRATILTNESLTQKIRVREVKNKKK